MAGENPTTYPESWDDLPGTKTAKPSPEHGNAVEQEYHLAESKTPVKKGQHVRPKLNETTPPTGP